MHSRKHPTIEVELLAKKIFDETYLHRLMGDASIIPGSEEFDNLAKKLARKVQGRLQHEQGSSLPLIGEIDKLSLKVFNEAYDLIDWALQLLVEEAKYQCQLGLIGYNSLVAQMREPHIEVHVCMLLMHTMLTHAANASKLFWPREGSLKKYTERGARLREELSIPDNLVIKRRDYRNHLEHYDVRLQDWVMKNPTGNIVDCNIMSRGAVIAGEGVKMGVHRNLDPLTLTFCYEDEDYPLPQIAEELQLVHGLVHEWLQARKETLNI